MSTSSKYEKGLPLDEANKEWQGDDHAIDRERTLYRLMYIKSQTTSGGYYGCGNCKVCGTTTSYGSTEYGGTVWPNDLLHHITFHEHKPNDETLQAINYCFEDKMAQEVSYVRQGVMKQQKRAAESSQKK